MDRSRSNILRLAAAVLALGGLVAGVLLGPPVFAVLMGRLHPLAVHFPIALLLLAAGVEAASRLRGARPTSAGAHPIAVVVLTVGAVTAAATVGSGLLHANQLSFSGETSETLDLHRISGVATALFAAVAAAFAHALRNLRSPKLEAGYLATLALAAGGVAMSGHLGGTLVYGSDYLSAAFFDGQGEGALSETTEAGQKIDFVADVQPILRERCLECHGPDRQDGALRLDAKHLAISGGRSGKAIVPGRPDQSTLLTRVRGRGGERRMPLRDDPLGTRQIATLRSWIAAGAPWPDSASVRDAVLQTHWAYEAFVRPELPETDRTDWARNPIDHFVLARLEQEDLSPSPEASRETLLRRLYLDLIGLPPSVEEVEAFVSGGSKRAYDEVVDSLLSSPHFGEKWARHWLDLARYADSNGFERDATRSAWPYRDWVIEAFNDDLPFDRFAVQQIAGDLLPDASDRERIATGFHRNTMINEEGGVDPDEALWEVRIDRTNTTATAFLGTTLGCAQCHDHKFDPISQRDYYAFMAFFSNTDFEAIELAGGLEGPTIPRREPVLELPNAAQAERRDTIEREIRSLEAELAETTPALAQAQLAWDKRMRERLSSWRPLHPENTRSTGGSHLQVLGDDSVLAGRTNPATDTYVVQAKLPIDRVAALRVEALTHPSLPKGGPGRYVDGGFVLTGVDVELDGEPLALAEARADLASPYHSPRVLTEKPKRLGLMARHADALVGWSVPDSGTEHRVVFTLADPPSGVEGRTLTVRLEHERGVVPRLAIGRFRLSVFQEGDPFETYDLSGSVREALVTDREERSEEQRRVLAAAYRRVAPGLDEARARLLARRSDLEALGIERALVVSEQPGPERPFARLHERGAYTSPAEKVYARTPAFLPPLGHDQMPNRLGLANWIASADNPLTARVAVNRVWAEIFGRGIVATPDDFGTQGELPSHPELLDWLASEFVASGWSTKELVASLVKSAAYRQGSSVTPALLERDPDNRLLSRGARYRLPAELVRDVTLSAGGKLSSKVGGPSVFPYQPEGVWNAPLNASVWVESEGEERHRRGLYTYWRRTSLHPMLAAFDAPSREQCEALRAQTNTPVQALALLNDRGLFEAALGLANQLAAAPSDDVRARAGYGFRRVLGRPPAPEELEALVSLYEQEVAHYGESPDAARAVGGNEPAEPAPIELAAWTSVAQALLNLDEAVTRQ